MASTNNSQTMVSIEDLYKYFGILADAKEEAGKHSDVYLKLIAGTKSGIKEKQLASQFITRFFKYFPNETPIAIDAIFDLCEDEDVNIRKAAIKDLGLLCKDCAPEQINRIADILTQLLQTDDQHESLMVQNSLINVLKENPKSALTEIFNQINTAELELVRKRAIKFLVSKVPSLLISNVINKELEEIVIKHVKQALVDVDAEEFLLFIRLLTSLPSMNTLTGRQEMVNVIMAQSELEKPFEDNDVERIMILLSCIQQANPLFSKNVQSTKYVNQYLDNVMSKFKTLTDENIKFEILKSFAELCMHFNGLSNPTATNLSILYDLLIDYLPKPSDNDQEQREQEAKFNFSYVECLLHSFHLLAKFQPAFLTSDENKERLRDFRMRLQYFAKGTQNYIKELKNTLNGNTNQKENEEDKIRRVALRVTTNVDILIKDFFHNPPSYKSSISLSWKVNEPTPSAGTTPSLSNQNGATKRSLSVDQSDESNRKKPERGIYQPPSGKYSNATSNSMSNNNGKRRTFSNDPNRKNNFGHFAHRNGRF